MDPPVNFSCLPFFSFSWRVHDNIGIFPPSSFSTTNKALYLADRDENENVDENENENEQKIR